ncbi:MAG: hypothetical protein GY835_28170 [bacterium]|nr:hypothetical protein [bacterium]
MPTSRGVWAAADPTKLARDLRACLRTAVAEQIDVLVLPELALTLPDPSRADFLEEVSTTSQAERMIVVAGSFYDADRYSRLVVVGPGWTEFGYKVRPSRFEVSPLANEGMRPGPEILALQTDYGNLVVITCVDLISDEVQFLVRSMATRGELDVLININHNPAAWEFLIEANGIVRRHPLFASITNVYVPAGGRCLRNDQPHDNGYCYGHSAVFASLRTRASERPNSSQRILDVLPELLPDPVVARGADGKPIARRLPYSNVAASLGAFREALLVYELNMRLKRVPGATNAPDQGYPPIRGIKVVDLLHHD